MKKMGFFGLMLACAFQWMALHAEINETGKSSASGIDFSKNAGCCECQKQQCQGMRGPPGPIGPAGATGLSTLISANAWNGMEIVPSFEMVRFSHYNVYPPGAPQIQPIVVAGQAIGFTLAPEPMKSSMEEQ